MDDSDVLILYDTTTTYNNLEDGWETKHSISCNKYFHYLFWLIFCYYYN